MLNRFLTPSYCAAIENFALLRRYQNLQRKFIILGAIISWSKINFDKIDPVVRSNGLSLMGTLKLALFVIFSS